MVGYGFLKIFQFCLIPSMLGNQTTDTHFITHEKFVHRKLKGLYHLLSNDIFGIIISIIFATAKAQ